jgi:hypothetical protein
VDLHFIRHAVKRRACFKIAPVSAAGICTILQNLPGGPGADPVLTTEFNGDASWLAACIASGGRIVPGLIIERKGAKV